MLLFAVRVNTDQVRLAKGRLFQRSQILQQLRLGVHTHQHGGDPLLLPQPLDGQLRKSLAPVLCQLIEFFDLLGTVLIITYMGLPSGMPLAYLSDSCPWASGEKQITPLPLSRASFSSLFFSTVRSKME